MTSCPSACTTRPLPSGGHPASPATWPTWVTCPPSATRDTCCLLPRPFILHSVTPTTPIARQSGPSLTEGPPPPPQTQNSSACRSRHAAINTKWPSHHAKGWADLLRYVQWLGGEGLSVGLCNWRSCYAWLHRWDATESGTFADSVKSKHDERLPRSLGDLWLTGMEWTKMLFILFAYFYWVTLVPTSPWPCNRRLKRSLKNRCSHLTTISLYAEIRAPPMLLSTTAMDRQTDRETDFSAGGLKTGSQLQHPYASATIQSGPDYSSLRPVLSSHAGLYTTTTLTCF